MSEKSLPLFRTDVLRARADRLHGSVNIATPISWQIIGILLFAALIATIVFLSMASYARVETVPGDVSLDKGVAMIVPTRTGLIEYVSVSEGEHVRAGQKLAIVRAEESLISGATAPDRIHDALNRADNEFADQSRLLLQASMADQQRLKAQINGDLVAIPSLISQIADQQQLIATAERDYNGARDVAARGYISRHDMDQREATILTRRQQLAQLQQTLSDKQASVAQARRAIIQSAIAARAQAANAQSNRASISQQQAQTDLARGYALTAPVDGIVTAVTARPGQPVTPGQQLMLVVPAHAQLRVELYVPTTAAGFLAPGQDVRLSIDAFPYQTFGTVKARVASVSGAAIMRQGTNGIAPVYLVVASTSEPWVMAFGRKQALLPGMTLSARIITEKRSLIEWLFEPLFAVRKR